MRIVRLSAHLEDDVRELYAECHPGWAPLPADWFKENETLIAIDESLPEFPRTVAYTSYQIRETEAGRGMFLQDTAVVPDLRGRGLARALMSARLDIARDLGASWAAGMTQPDNTAMLRLLRSFEFREIGLQRGVYKQIEPPADGVLFILPLVG